MGAQGETNVETRSCKHQNTPIIRQYVILTCTIAVIVVVAFSAYVYQQQQASVKQQMLAEARVLNTSVMSTWKFVDYQQANINTDRDGVYNFKGIYCSLVGKGVAKLFTLDTDNEYTMRYVRFNPRNVKDEPDAFEADALDSFHESGLSESYNFVTNDKGKREFRYVAAIPLTKNCLDCHGGSPEETDITGHAKEGMKEGDIGGAVSITMPVELHEANVRSNMLNSVFLMVVFLSIVFAVSFFFFRSQVIRPLAQLGKATEAIGKGELRTTVSMQGAREVSELARNVMVMERELDEMYATLEEKVNLRTKQYLDANALLDSQKEKIAEQNALLKRANEKLRDENEYRTSIVSILSHELRTPLTAILAFVDLWQELEGDHDEQSVEYCRKIKRHSLALLEMVNNVLDLAKIEAGTTQVSKEVVDLVDLVSDIASIEEPIAELAGIRFATHVDENVPLIREDWQRLRKVVMNLTSNAVKFTDREGSVVVRVSFNPSSETVRITVSDTGIGIPSDRIEGIFERFVQVDPSISRKYSGTGLGLSLVKKTMESMGGSVSVKSEEGQGSTFSIVFPVEVVEED